MSISFTPEENTYLTKYFENPDWKCYFTEDSLEEPKHLIQQILSLENLCYPPTNFLERKKLCFAKDTYNQIWPSTNHPYPLVKIILKVTVSIAAVFAFLVDCFFLLAFLPVKVLLRSYIFLRTRFSHKKEKLQLIDLKTQLAYIKQNLWNTVRKIEVEEEESEQFKQAVKASLSERSPSPVNTDTSVIVDEKKDDGISSKASAIPPPRPTHILPQTSSNPIEITAQISHIPRGQIPRTPSFPSLPHSPIPYPKYGSQSAPATYFPSASSPYTPSKLRPTQEQRSSPPKTGWFILQKYVLEENSSSDPLEKKIQRIKEKYLKNISPQLLIIGADGNTQKEIEIRSAFLAISTKDPLNTYEFYRWYSFFLIGIDVNYQMKTTPSLFDVINNLKKSMHEQIHVKRYQEDTITRKLLQSLQQHFDSICALNKSYYKFNISQDLSHSLQTNSCLQFTIDFFRDDQCLFKQNTYQLSMTLIFTFHNMKTNNPSIDHRWQGPIIKEIL